MEIGIIVQNGNDLQTKWVKCKKVKFDISNYSEDFLPVHNNIVSNLKKDKSGVYLLYGLPGTGKTSYINSLMNCVNKKFVFVSSSLFHGLDSPTFLSYLLDYKNHLFVIEDAEKLLVSRDNDKILQ